MKIIVESEKDKEDLIIASRYLHYARYISRKIPGINTLSHIYCNPDLIEVKENKNVDSHSSESK